MTLEREGYEDLRVGALRRRSERGGVHEIVRVLLLPSLPAGRIFLTEDLGVGDE